MPPRGNGFVGLCAISGLVALALVPAPAGAETTLNVEVGCTDMTPEQRASVEARTRAELAMVGVSQGELDVHCWPPLVVVQYSTGGFPLRSSSQHLTGDPAAWIEQILSTVHNLLTQKAEAAAPPVEVTALPEQATAQAVPEAAISPSDVTGDRPARAEAHAPEGNSSSWRPEEPRGEPLARNAGIGVCVETWGKPLAILPGACASVAVRSSLARLALTGGLQWSAMRVHDIKMRHWQVGIEWSFGHPFWFALGGQVSVFQLTPKAGLRPASTSTYDPSVTLRVGRSVPIARDQLRMGVGLRVQPAHEVQVDGSPKFSVPNIVFTMDAAYDFGW